MVNSMVERATSDMLIGPDWALNLEICDILNHDPGLAKDVVKGIKKRIGSRNAKVQILALTLLETIIKNCGDIVHMYVAERDVLHEMVKIAKKRHADFHVKEKILTLIDTWQEAFGGPRSRYPQYYSTYQELLRAGAVFPQRSEQSAPVFTPPQTQPLSSHPQNIRNTDHQQDRAESSAEPEFPTLSLSEIQNARGILDVLCEMLNALDPGNKEGLKREVIVDLVEQCRMYKQRVVHLVNSTSDESLLCQGLALNDDLQRVLAKHEAIASGTSIDNQEEKTNPKSMGALLDLYGPLVDTGESSNQTQERSNSTIGAGDHPFNQLSLPPPPTTNGPNLVSADPTIDLLSGDDFTSPKAEPSLTTVPAEQTPSSECQQNADVPFDMFVDGNNVTSSVNIQPTILAGPISSTDPQFQQQQNFVSPQREFYPNGSTPNTGPPGYEQSQYLQTAGASLNGQVSQHLQQSSLTYGAQSSESLPPPPWETQKMDNDSSSAASQYPQPLLFNQAGLTHAQSGGHPQGPQPIGNIQPFTDSHLSEINGQVSASNQLGLPSQSTQALPGPYLGMMPQQMHGGPVVSTYPQQMYGNQFIGYGYDQQGAQYLEQRMYGLSVNDNGLRNSLYQGSSSLPSRKPSKPEDKLFGDLVDMAKLKPKPTLG